MATRDPLVEALARGFSSWEDRERLARAAGLKDPQLAGDPYDVWDALIEQAVDEGQLAALAEAVTREGRPRLGTAVKAGGLPDSRPRAAVLMAALMGASLFLFLFYIVLEQDDRAPLATGASIEAAGREGLPLPSPDLPDREPSEEALEREPSEEATVAEPAELGVAKQAAAEEEPPAPSADLSPTGWGDCTAVPGVRIGYAWAGEAAPSSPWKPGAPINVREDYPRVDNGWNTKSSTVCILPADAVVDLSEGVIEVDGGAVYVAIVAPLEAP